MPRGVFLINGVGLPYHVIDTAIGWAKQNNNSLLGVFIFNEHRHAETYSFPSDIEQTETLVSEEEAEKGLEKLITLVMQYIQKQVVSQAVDVKTVSLKNAERDQLQHELKKGDVLFADPENFKGPDEYASTAFSFEDIIALSPKVIEVRRNNNGKLTNSI